jgi:hypothetical protein
MGGGPTLRPVPDATRGSGNAPGASPELPRPVTVRDPPRQDTPADQRRGNPSRDDAAALGLWFASRLGLLAVVVAGSWLGGIDAQGRVRDAGRWLVDRFTYWDSLHFTRIAELGYLPPGLDCCDQAYFPGYPLLMRALSPATGGDVAVAGIVISLVAGAVAAVMLQRLGRLAGGATVGATAALYLSVAPYGIFLSAVYSEALFLACALGAWWAGVTRRWWVAGLLAGAAAAVRINGLFLAAALGVMYALQMRAEGRRRPDGDAVALLVPIAVTGAYVAYLHQLTGSWNAWQEAQARGWQRTTAWPWEGLFAGWNAAVSAGSPQLLVSRWADLLAVVAGLLLVAVLVRLRRWPEAVYLGLSVGVLVCSTMLTSAARYALLWFPGYLLLAHLTARPGWRWLRHAVVVACVPLLAAFALSFSARYWVA